MAVDRPRIAVAWHAEAPREALLLCCRVEEVRATVGPRHSRQATGVHDAGPGERAVESQWRRRWRRTRQGHVRENCGRNRVDVSGGRPGPFAVAPRRGPRPANCEPRTANCELRTKECHNV